MKDKVNFLPADKFQIFPQIGTNTLGVWPGMPKLPPKNKSAVSLQYLTKEVSDEIDFCMPTSMKTCYKLKL